MSEKENKSPPPPPPPPPHARRRDLALLAPLCHRLQSWHSPHWLLLLALRHRSTPVLDPSSLVVLAHPGSPAVTCRIGCSTAPRLLAHPKSLMAPRLPKSPGKAKHRWTPVRALRTSVGRGPGHPSWKRRVTLWHLWLAVHGRGRTGAMVIVLWPDSCGLAPWRGFYGWRCTGEVGPGRWSSCSGQTVVAWLHGGRQAHARPGARVTQGQHPWPQWLAAYHPQEEEEVIGQESSVVEQSRKGSHRPHWALLQLRLR
jgi:hypothetical protein